MASDFPPKKNVATQYFISVYKTGVIVANPAISAGDFKYSLDGGTITNLATLPDVYPASGTQVRIQLAQAEMNGDKLNIIAHSAAGVFDDFNIMISTALLQMGDAGLIQSGTGTGQLSITSGVVSATVSDKTGFSLSTASILAIWNQLETDAGLIANSIGLKLHTLLVSAGGKVSAILVRWKTDDAAGTPLDLTGAFKVQVDSGSTGLTAQATRDAMKLAPSSGSPAAGSIDALITTIPTTSAPNVGQIDTQLSNSHGSGAWGAGGTGGSLHLTHTLTNSVTLQPVEGATIYLYVDAGLVTIIDNQTTNAFGQVTFNNLVAGTYYLKIVKPGYAESIVTKVVA